MKAAYEPTDEECEWKADEEEELTVSKQVQVTYTPACFVSNQLNVVFVLYFMHAACNFHPKQNIFDLPK